MSTTLAYKQGWLCMAETANDYERPIMRTLYYPIYPCTPTEAETWPIGSNVKAFQSMLYVYDGNGRESRLELKDGSATRPMCNEETPIPAPRAKLTRWTSGRWEKYTQAKGWQVAY